MQTITATNAVTAAEKFCALVFQGIEAWTQAGKIAAAQIDADPTWPEKISQKEPAISEEIVRRFEAIGRQQLHPRLLLSAAPGARALRRLPYALQERHITEPVPLLVRTADGWETLNVDLHNLTQEQADQVFDRDAIRTPPAQRAYIEARAAKASRQAIPSATPYRLVGKTLVVLQPCTLTTKELARLIAEMQ